MGATIEDTERAETNQELLEKFTNLHTELSELTEMTRKRLKDLRDPAQQDDLQAALALLKITTPIMIASSKVFVRHPEMENARINREFARNEMLKAIDGIKAR